MANLFWGVSDALDLYDEYINAKKQKGQTSPKKAVVETGTVEATENENEATICNTSGNLNVSTEDIKNSEDSNECIESGKKIPGSAETEVKDVEKDDLPYLNVDTKVCLENVEIQYDIDSKELAENDHENPEDNPIIDPAGKGNIENHTEKSEDCTTISAANHNTQDLKSYGESQNEDAKSLTVGTVSAACFETSDSNEQKSVVKEPTFENKVEELTADSQPLENIELGKKEDSESKNMEERSAIDEKKQGDESTNFKPSCVETSSDLNICDNSIRGEERQKAGEESVATEQCNPTKDGALPYVSNDVNSCSEEAFEETKPHVLNILIYGGGDPRHIIKTMAKRYTHCQNEGTASSVPILKFYIIDGCMEIVARNIVLLGIALERPELISLRNKVHLFMDVYGNSLLRPICHQYLVSKSTTLLKMVSDKQTLEKMAPFIKIDALKYREIDALQDAFEFWQPKPGYEFNIKDYWMARIRQLLTVRYDTREGVFDWDLNMSLKDRGGQQICSQEYRYWRETGIAFTYPEYEQCKPNKTLSAGLVRNGDRYLHRGYIGDIQTGPFCTFGLRSIEERMHRSAHGENDYRATDVTERNLLEYFHEIQNGTSYVHNDAVTHKYGGVRFQMGERLIHNEYDMKGICAYDQPWINVEGIEVHFLPLEEVKKIGKGGPKWENFFDVAFVGYKFFDFLNDAFTEVLRENSLLILETKLRSVEIKNRITEFETELHGYALDAKLVSVLNYNALNSKNSILKYWKTKNE